MCLSARCLVSGLGFETVEVFEALWGWGCGLACNVQPPTPFSLLALVTEVANSVSYVTHCDGLAALRSRAALVKSLFYFCQCCVFLHFCHLSELY